MVSTEEASGSTTAQSGSGTSSGSDKESPPPPPPEKKHKLHESSSLSSKGKATKSKSGSAAGITNGALASRPAPAGASKLSKLQGDITEPKRDKVLEIAESRKVYKSLFSSNAAERPKELTSNWVTFFPYH